MAESHTKVYKFQTETREVQGGPKKWCTWWKCRLIFVGGYSHYFLGKCTIFFGPHCTSKQGKQCFQRWNKCVRFKVVRLSSLIPWDLRHAEQLLFLCPCSNLTVYRRSFFAHPLCDSLSCLQYGISFGNKKPDHVGRAYLVYLVT